MVRFYIFLISIIYFIIFIKYNLLYIGYYYSTYLGLSLCVLAYDSDKKIFQIPSLFTPKISAIEYISKYLNI